MARLTLCLDIGARFTCAFILSLYCYHQLGKHNQLAFSLLAISYFVVISFDAYLSGYSKIQWNSVTAILNGAFSFGSVGLTIQLRKGQFVCKDISEKHLLLLAQRDS